MMFREKPIEAFQYVGEKTFKNDKGEWKIPKWAVTALFYGILHISYYCDSVDGLWLKDSAGDSQRVNYEDYLVQKHNGEIIVVSAEDFESSYEQVSESENGK